MSGELLIPFGRRLDGRMVAPSAPDLVRGLACECRCPVCGSRLIARRGQRNRPNFAHESEAGCSGAAESSVHLMAKQIIAENFAMQLPRITVRSYTKVRNFCHLETDNWHRLVNIRTEKWLGDFRPDVMATFNGCVSDGFSRSFASVGQDVLIEIAVTHFCDKEKIEKIRDYGIACFQIDLSSAFKRLLNEDDLRDAIGHIAYREWLYHPFIDQTYLDLRAAERAEWEAEDLLRNQLEEELKVSEAARQLKMRADIEANKALLAERRAQEVRILPSVVFEPKSTTPPPLIIEKRAENRKPYYDYNDLTQRAAMEELLRQPVRRTK